MVGKEKLGGSEDGKGGVGFSLLVMADTAFLSISTSITLYYISSVSKPRSFILI